MSMTDSLLKYLGKQSYSLLKSVFFLGDNKLYSGRYMNARERKSILSAKHKGICVNGYEKLEQQVANRGTAIFGATGTGKTSSIIIPTVLDCEHSLFVMDPSLEIYEATSGYKQSQGFEIRLLNFSDPANSLSYNPLKVAGKDRKKLREIATALVENAIPDKGSDQGFWNTAAIDMLNTVFQILSCLDTKFQNLPNALQFLQLMNIERFAIDKLVNEQCTPHIQTEYMTMGNMPEKLFQNVLQTVKIALSTIVTDDDIARLLCSHTIDFEDCRKKKVVYYISATEQDLSNLYGGIVAVFISQLINHLYQGGKRKNQVSVLLEELPLFKIPGLAIFSTQCRKHNVALVLLCQDYSQLEYRYGKELTKTMIYGGCNTRIFLGGQPLAMAEELSKSFGKIMTTYRDHDLKTQESVRLLMEGNDIMTLAKDKGILVHSNLPPLLMDIKPFFKQPKLIKKTKMKPASKARSGLDPIIYLS